ncbi:hypothetical protein IEQ34_007527 [Dendrobium chrysotoxum]|uniref:Uncharacterized protein n=1 Tax=Dendrobium chrysotoxum TaxID=161865 RepID=A0AAV7GM12_DENCH|nr:hypothetical protein IEQ34_007527 [Dendrobium chrysotoxum]
MTGDHHSSRDPMTKGAGLWFPPPLELIDISARCGSYISDDGADCILQRSRSRSDTEYLSRMGRFIIDTQGHITFTSKWLDMRTRDPLKSWTHAFFYVKNDWGLIEKWGRIKDLPVPLNVREEDILRILNIPEVKRLLFKVRYLTKYIEEEFLFKKSISFKTIIHDRLQEAREHIYDVEVKALEQ